MNNEFATGTFAAGLLVGAASCLVVPKLKNAAKAVVASMSGAATASFGSKNTVDASKIGYVTKEGMQLYGMSKDAETGQTTYHYTKRIGYMNHEDAEKAIEELNRDAALTSVYGEANFPTDYRTKTNELGMMFKEQAALGIKDDYIHGEGLFANYSRYLYCSHGNQGDDGKYSSAAAFPSWSRPHPMR